MPTLEARAYLGAPIVLTDALHLDGMLQSVHPSCVGGHLRRTDPTAAIIRPKLPIASLTAAGVTLYASSAEEYPTEARRRSGHLTRRRDAADLDYLTSSIDRGAGPARDVLLRYPVVETPWMSWLCVGREKGVRQLLRRVEAVGALRRHGYGHILRWEVTVVEAPPVDCLVTGGRARRHLPSVWCEAPEVVDEGAVMPPYWHPSSTRPRVRRGTATGLTAQVLAACSGVW
jgi:hypothetical protein